MKKILAMLLAMAMAFSLAACGGKKGADDIPDTMTSKDGKYEVAFVTDVGQLKDKSFNQGTWDGVKLYASEHSLSYKYYQPANGDNATDDDRYNAMKQAAEGGAKVIVCAGFLQEAALAKAAEEFPDAHFVFIDNNHPVVGSDGNPLKNVASVEFQEEQAGYLAGYAVVKEGYTKLGFSGGGGGSNPACCRYGYGYVQGANDAAKELGVHCGGAHLLQRHHGGGAGRPRGEHRHLRQSAHPQRLPRHAEDGGGHSALPPGERGG